MASEDRILKILLQIQSDLGGIDKVKTGVGDVKKSIDDASKSAFSLGDAFKFAGAEEGLRRVLDFVKDIPTKIIEGVKAGIDFDAEIQVLQTRLAGLLLQLDSSKFPDWASAFAAAGDEVDALKDKSNELGIEYRDLFESFSHIQAVLSAAGIKDFNQQLDLSIQLTRALQTVGINASIAFRDIGDILRGQASIARVGGTALASLMGFASPQELDVFVNQHRLLGDLQQAMMDKLKGIQATSSQLGQTFTAELNRMKNALLDVEGETAKPIMQPLLDAMREMSTKGFAPEVIAGARTLGTVIVDTTAGVKDLIKYLEYLKYLPPVAIGLKIAGAGPIASIYDEEKDQLRLQTLDKQTAAIKEQVAVAGTQGTQAERLQAVQAAEIALNNKIVEVKKEIAAETLKGGNAESDTLPHLRDILKNLIDIGAKFFEIQGTAGAVKGAVAAITPEVQKLLDTMALYHAETYGTDADIYKAKWVATYHAIAEEAKKLPGGMAEWQLQQATYERLRGPERAKELNAPDESALAFLREESLLLQEIHNREEIIAQNPFLSIGQKEQLAIPLIISKIGELNSVIQGGEALLKGGTLDHAKYDEVAKAVDNLRTRVQLLGFQLQTTSFGGAFAADLVKWVNSFGSAAHQAANAFTSTLNTAIGGTSQALTGLILHTKNWQQAFAQAAQSIIQDIIKIALQFVVSQIIMRVIAGVTGKSAGSEAASQAAPVAAAWAPAATSVSIATYGVGTAVGLAAYQAAMATGAATAVGLSSLGAGARKGGYTGDIGEGEIAGPVHGKEFVFTADETRALGVPFLTRLAAAAGGTAKFPRYDTGGEIVVYDPTSGFYSVYNPSFEPSILPGNFPGPTYISGFTPTGAPSVETPTSEGWGNVPSAEISGGTPGYPSPYDIPPENIPIPLPPDMPAVPSVSTVQPTYAASSGGTSGGYDIGSNISGGTTSFSTASSGLYGAFEGGVDSGSVGGFIGGMSSAFGGGGGGGGGVKPRYLHSGGAIDGIHILAQIGEFMMQKKAHDYYGSDFMHDLNNMRIDAGAARMHSGGPVVSPSLGGSDSPASHGGGRGDMKLQIIHVNNWREAIKKALQSTDTRTAIIDMIKESNFQLGI